MRLYIRLNIPERVYESQKNQIHIRSKLYWSHFSKRNKNKNKLYNIIEYKILKLL